MTFTTAERVAIYQTAIQQAQQQQIEAAREVLIVWLLPERKRIA